MKKVVLNHGFYNEKGFHKAGEIMELDDKQAKFMLEKKIASLDLTNVASECEASTEKNQSNIETQIDTKIQADTDAEVLNQVEPETAPEAVPEVTTKATKTK